jgi:undecaprenyl-diphosphatase
VDLLHAIESLIIGAVLGITEFLPISSLGHSLVLSALFNFPPAAARNTFGLFIQGGAVLAVLVYYSRDFLQQAARLPTDAKTRQLWLNVLIAFLPIGVLGYIFRNPIQKYLFSPLIVALALIVGGIVFLVVDRGDHKPTTANLEAITWRQALVIGLAQVTALIPGISRSGATIIGGLLAGLDRTTATVFTFYLFIPTLGSAAGYALYSAYKDKQVDPALLPYFFLAAAVGFVISFIAMRWLLRYISTHDFRPFGVYRIVVGLLIIVLIFVGLAM